MPAPETVPVKVTAPVKVLVPEKVWVPVKLPVTPGPKAATTADYEPGATYVYDLEIVTGSTVTRLIQGQITVSGEITR